MASGEIPSHFLPPKTLSADPRPSLADPPGAAQAGVHQRDGDFHAEASISESGIASTEMQTLDRKGPGQNKHSIFGGATPTFIRFAERLLGPCHYANLPRVRHQQGVTSKDKNARSYLHPGMKAGTSRAASYISIKIGDARTYGTMIFHRAWMLRHEVPPKASAPFS